MAPYDYFQSLKGPFAFKDPIGQSDAYRENAFNQQRDQYNQRLEGLKRAQAREAPPGFETSSLWTDKTDQLDPNSLGSIYKQREAERAHAQTVADPRLLHNELMAQTAGGNMAGFIEGVNRNDIATGIADESYAPKQTRVWGGPSPEGSNAFRGVSVQPGGSLQGLQRVGRDSELSTDALIEQSQNSRKRGAQVRAASGGRVGRNETGRMI